MMIQIINSFKDKYAFLSNFYASPIEVDEKIYPTAEHLYQANKTADSDAIELIRTATTPGKAKRLGQKVDLIQNWELLKSDIMFQVLCKKFTLNEPLADLLLQTYPHTLVEGNYWHDNTWGDCYCKQCRSIKGQNQLGLHLMSLRNFLSEARLAYSGDSHA